MKQPNTESLGSAKQPDVCKHCGAGREILTDLDIRTQLGGQRGKTVSPYTTQKWRQDGKGPAYFKVAGRVVHYADEFHSWLETKRQTSTSSETANSDTTVEFDEPRAGDDTDTPEATEKWWTKEQRD